MRAILLALILLPALAGGQEKKVALSGAASASSGAGTQPKVVQLSGTAKATGGNVR